MAKLCDLCRKPIRKRDEVFRILVERARCSTGDSGDDPAAWTSVENWDDIFLSHTGCARLDAEAREDFLRVPLANVQYLLEQVDDDNGGGDDKGASHLSVVD